MGGEHRLTHLSVSLSRFINHPQDEVAKQLVNETKELQGDIGNLNKKLHYLETTHKNSREHIEQIFRRSTGGS